VLFRPAALLFSLALPAQLPSPGAEIQVPAAALESSAVVLSPIKPRSNETMEFAISFLGVRMGKARLFVGRVEPSIAPVFLQAQTSSVLSFITLREQLSTYLDPATGLPRSASLDAVEGSYRHSDTVQFDRIANKATVRERGKYDNTNVVDVPPGTLDFVGLVFKLRTLPLDDGMRHQFPVLSGRRLSTIVAEVVARETVSTSIGDLPAVKVRVPTGFTGKFSEKNPTHVWFSDDERRIIVRITTDFAVGHATAALVSYAPGEASADAAAARDPAR